MRTRSGHTFGSAAEPGAVSNTVNESSSRIFRYFGLHENPFNVSADPRYLSFTRRSQEAFDAIVYGIQSRQGLIVLTGEVGTGKTTLTKYLLNWLAERQSPTAYICNPRLSSSELFDFMFVDFGISFPAKIAGDKSAMLTGWLLAQNRAGRRPVLIVDEAQGLPLPALEQIRLLLNLETANEKLLQVVLVGQPELEQTLNRGELMRLRQRIMVRCRIGSLNSHETRAYILRRLRVAGAHGESVFSPEAMETVFEYSCGIPRVINNLCEHSLINAYAVGVPRISAEIVREVARDFDLDTIRLLGADQVADRSANRRADRRAEQDAEQGVDRIAMDEALAASFIAVPTPTFASLPAEAMPDEPEQIPAEEIALAGPAAKGARSLQAVLAGSSNDDEFGNAENIAEFLWGAEHGARWSPRIAGGWPKSPLRVLGGWHPRAVVDYTFAKIQRAASAVVRWLVEPVDPLNPWRTGRQNPQ